MNKMLLFLVLLLTTGCSGIDMTAYQQNKPALDVFAYFQGATRGWGIVQDRKGTLLRQFTVDIRGEVTEDGQLVLHEAFVWNDGEHSTRTWVLSRDDQHRYTGIAGDVVGKADGVVYGNVLNWQYLLKLKVKDSTWKIAFDDWMFRLNDGLVINRARMSKFGVTVGEVTLVFSKQQNGEAVLQ